MSHELTTDHLSRLRAGFAADPANRVAQNAVAETSISKVALNRGVVSSMDHTVSHLLDDWKVTNQKRSGRCWLFAGLNLLRAGAMKKLGTKEFEFSQNYLLFWDKIERVNYYLQGIVDTLDRDPDDRTVATMHERVLDDGGQWNMFVALIKKHGLVPKQAMPETESSSSTSQMNGVLRTVCHTAAKALRDAGSDDERQQVREETLATAWRILCIHLGTPPESFMWQWKDSDRGFHRDGEMTPQEFAAAYVTVDLDDYVCLVDDPRASSPRGRTFTVDQLGNIVGGDRVTYLNAGIDVIRKAAVETITEGAPVWFGCDTGPHSNADYGLWHPRLFEYDLLYRTEFTLDKAARLDYHESLMTHAMLFTGTDLDDSGRPTKWRVENSWGDEKADQGFWTMADDWFDEYVFEVAVHRKHLPADLLAALDDEPIVLPAWDPMGALAR